jgi:hypothetical protein
MVRVFCLAILFFMVKNSLAQKGFELIDDPQHKKVEVLYNSKLLTAYCYFDSTEKPVLFPIKTLSGITITRGYPIAPGIGERVDHPHHIGLWMNYESVNGIDFWNNSFAIPEEKKSQYGSIKHQEITLKNFSSKEASLETLSNWIDHSGKILLKEKTHFIFSVNENNFIIDRISALTAAVPEVILADVKDGFLGLRIARELELPSKQEDKFIDANGNVTVVSEMNNNGVTGNYISSEGITGDDVWGTRAR